MQDRACYCSVIPIKQAPADTCTANHSADRRTAPGARPEHVVLTLARTRTGSEHNASQGLSKNRKFIMQTIYVTCERGMSDGFKRQRGERSHDP